MRLDALKSQSLTLIGREIREQRRQPTHVLLQFAPFQTISHCKSLYIVFGNDFGDEGLFCQTTSVAGVVARRMLNALTLRCKGGGSADSDLASLSPSLPCSPEINFSLSLNKYLQILERW